MNYQCRYCSSPFSVLPGQVVQCQCGALYTAQVTTSTSTSSLPMTYLSNSTASATPFAGKRKCHKCGWWVAYHTEAECRELQEVNTAFDAHGSIPTGIAKRVLAMLDGNAKTDVPQAFYKAFEGEEAWQ